MASNLETQATTQALKCLIRGKSLKEVQDSTLFQSEQETPFKKNQRIKKTIQLMEDSIEKADLIGITEALDQGADINFKSTKSSLSAIQMFTRKGDSTSVDVLIKRGAAVVGVRDQAGYSLLYYALNQRNLKLAQLLVQSGVSLAEPVNSNGQKAYPISFLLGHNGSDQFLPFFREWVEYFGFKETFNCSLDSFGNRELFVNNIRLALSAIVASVKEMDLSEDAHQVKACQMIIKNLGGDWPLTLDGLQKLEMQLHEGVSEKKRFSFSQLLNDAVQRDSVSHLSFLLEMGLIHSFRVQPGKMEKNSSSVSALWVALKYQSKKCFDLLIQIKSLREEAAEDILENAEPIFEFINDIPLRAWDQLNKMEVDMSTISKEGNSIFHVLAREGNLLKGHLSFAETHQLDGLFSHKNKDGFTPFDIPCENQYSSSDAMRPTLQRHLESKLFPNMLNRLEKEDGLPKPGPASRKRM